jgi:hypothetical protein
MTDWKALARAAGVPATDAELDTLATVLSVLDRSFRSLPLTLTPADDPAPFLADFGDQPR